MKLGLKIALRFLKSNKGQTILIILGIAIGVSVQVFIGSLIQGLQKSLINTTIGSSSHITVTMKDKEVDFLDYENIIAKIEQSDLNIKEITPVLNNSSFLTVGENSQSLLIRGMDIEKAEGIYKIKERLVEGTVPTKKGEIVIGIDLQKEYSLKLNDTIDIKTPSGKEEKAKIVGFFDFKVANINTGWGIVSIDYAKEIYETNAITAIEMQVTKDMEFEADLISDKVEKLIGSDSLKITNWKVENEQLLSGLQGQSISSYMIQTFVLVSVVIGIASVLAITVLQKSRQIGILKAMGLKNKTTSYVFLFEGFILGTFGAIGGVLFGLGLSLSFTKFAVNSDGSPVVALFISPSFIALSAAIAIIASLIAALIPAIRSSKLDPIDIIRNN